MKLNRLMQIYAGITRVNEEERIVEGIAFANEVVDGEGGIRLKREAMQAATPDYLRWGAVREMHTASAAGTAESVEWQEDGTAIIRAKVVDDSAWNKVKEGVYKGFSVGVKPRIMRGKSVEACTWIETSLVDRPKDPGAVLTLHRAEGEEGEYEVEELDEEVTETRGAFADMYAKERKYQSWYAAQDVLRSLLWDIQDSQDEAQTKKDRAAAAIDEFKAEILGQLERGDIPELTRVETTEQTVDMITRADHETQISALVTRAETAESRLAEERTARAEAEERAEKAEAARRRPRLNTAVERIFPTMDKPAEGESIDINAEIQRLLASPGETDEQRVATSMRISQLKAQQR